MAIRKLPPLAKDVLPDADEDALVVYQFLERLLDRVVSIYEKARVPLPARRYWMMGPQPSEDCAQVVVAMLQTYLGYPGDQASEGQDCDRPRTAVINIHVTREFPKGDEGAPVSVDAITEASKWMAMDAAVLSAGLAELTAYPDGLPGPKVIATINTQEPGGGVQTTILNISLTIT